MPTVTPTEYSNQLLTTVLYDVSDVAPDRVRTLRLITAIQSQTGDEEYGPWHDIHGTGGTMESPWDGVIVVRQTERTQLEIRDTAGRCPQRALWIARSAARPIRRRSRHVSIGCRLPPHTSC